MILNKDVPINYQILALGILIVVQFQVVFQKNQKWAEERTGEVEEGLVTVIHLEDMVALQVTHKSTSHPLVTGKIALDKPRFCK